MAGSTYTPELVDGIARLRDEIEVDQLVLCDPDPTRLERRRRRQWTHRQAPWVERDADGTPDLAEAVDGADFVLLQLRIGGQAARHLDETIPLRCGCVGQETTGAGGFAKALRRCRSCSTSPMKCVAAPRPMRGSSTSPIPSGS